jgi:hypothetical protein
MKRPKDIRRVIFHRDKTVSFWSVYWQKWVRHREAPDRELLAMEPETRAKVLEHIAE